MRLLRDGVTPEEQQAIEAVAEAWQRRKGGAGPLRRTSVYRRALLWLMAGLLSVGVVLFSLKVIEARRVASNSAEHVVQLLLGDNNRPFQSQLAGQPYRTFIQTRSADAGSIDFDTIESVIVRQPGDSYEMGRFYLLQQRFDKAAASLETAAAVHSSPQIMNDLGVAYFETGGEANLTRAVDAFRRALELDRDFAPAVFNLSLAYQRKGALPDAENQWRRYLQLDGASGWASEIRSKLQNMSR
jgi:tetratricopeptide (TPR) repeat protein